MSEGFLWSYLWELQSGGKSTVAFFWWHFSSCSPSVLLCSVCFLSLYSILFQFSLCSALNPAALVLSGVYLPFPLFSLLLQFEPLHPTALQCLLSNTIGNVPSRKSALRPWQSKYFRKIWNILVCACWWEILRLCVCFPMSGTYKLSGRGKAAGRRIWTDQKRTWKGPKATHPPSYHLYH